MKNTMIRVRFAPAPTGMMHLGNIRAALMNYLFAQQQNGTFVLRIEDTDPARNFDPHGAIIRQDLAWLNLTYDEGPEKGGPHAPYIQSERTDLYQQQLEKLIAEKKAYRCFCTPQELDKKRQRQIALKQPPRYDRTCLNLSEDEIEAKLKNNTPFIWRFKLDHAQSITITDMARGPITFELKNFSDFPLTRNNGTVTFMFANTVDDATMKITHVMRGEDHLTNTAGQVALMQALNAPLPIFLHMPILCNIDGKKLSKRDFGFSLQDLKKAGFLPEAICNYLAIIGGSFEQEIMSLDELAKTYDFSTINSSGHITYAVDKLRWVNHQWIMRYTSEKLAHACRPFLEQAYPAAKQLSDEQLAQLLLHIRTDLETVTDSVKALHFYFITPDVDQETLQHHVAWTYKPTIEALIAEHISGIEDTEKFVTTLKREAAEKKIPLRELFSYIRLALTGKAKGPSVHDLIAMLGPEKTKQRLAALRS